MQGKGGEIRPKHTGNIQRTSKKTFIKKNDKLKITGLHMQILKSRKQMTYQVETI